jgi:FkbM family methyltransferase
MSAKSRILEFSNKKRVRKLDRVLTSLPEFRHIHLIDIGAAGDIEPRWRSISKFISYLGFEPDERSREELKDRNNQCSEYEIVPKAVWEYSGKFSLQLCAKPEVSSFFPPNLEFLNHFPKRERFEFHRTEEIDCVTLDSLDLKNPDFIKIDIQGGELLALVGATKTLENCFGLELEVEFLELYKGQPLFGEIVKYLEGHGFQFIDFVNLCRWERDSHDGLGQLVFGDGLFLRMPEHFIDLSQPISRISSYLATLLLYERYDLLEVCSRLLSQEGGDKFTGFFDLVGSQRKSFNRFNKWLWILNILIKSGNQNRHLHLIH